jgi:hypothetical protein
MGLIRENGYSFSDFHNSHKYEKACIIHHDVDFQVEEAVILSELENKIGLCSTYFILLRTDMYNLFSKRNISNLQNIQSQGHEIGLHFDEKYIEDTSVDIRTAVKKEARILSEATGRDIRVVSMHRPSRKTLEADYDFGKIENACSRLFLKDHKYLSDSRRQWREDAEAAIRSGLHKKLHIALHPNWYTEKEITLKESVCDFIDSASEERYVFLSENIRDLDSIIGQE